MSDDAEELEQAEAVLDGLAGVFAVGAPAWFLADGVNDTKVRVSHVGCIGIWDCRIQVWNVAKNQWTKQDFVAKFSELTIRTDGHE